MKALRKRIAKLEEEFNAGGEGFYIASYDKDAETYTLIHTDGHELNFNKKALLKWLNGMRGKVCNVQFLAVVIDNGWEETHPSIIRTKDLKQTKEDEIIF